MGGDQAKDQPGGPFAGIMAWGKRATAWVLATRPARAVLSYLEHHGPMLADSITYRTLFSVFAGLFLGFAIGGIWLSGNPDAMDALVATIGAAIPGLPVTDTLKQVDAVGAVTQTVDRTPLRAVQTPQGFRRLVLEDAVRLGLGGVVATDEAMLAERAGHPVAVVEGDERNVKITTPEDLAAARANLAGPARVGTGYDLHRLVEGRPLILGGVTVPFERGALGHSDADVVCHAATDAILGGACLGDIGRHFPDTDPRWEGVSSIDLLRQAAALVRDAGFDLLNLDVVVVLERPKILPYLEAIRAGVAAAAGLPAARVSVKGKTNEGVDAVGRGEAIASHAVALLREGRTSPCV